MSRTEWTDEELVLAAQGAEPDAFGTLAQRWFDRCWEVAWRILRDRDHAADVAQETLLKAWHQLERLDQPASFGGWVLRIARNGALDRLEKERRAVPTDDDRTLEPRGHDRVAVAEPELEFGRGLQHDLVWAAAEALGERDASMLDLHLRHGLEPHELAEELGIAPNAAHQALFRMRKRLGGAVQAWLLWRNGRPTCHELRAALAAADVERFGQAAMRTIEKHASACTACAENRDRVTAPAAMFSSVPFVLPPPELREDAFVMLSHAGVPMGPVGRPSTSPPRSGLRSAGRRMAMWSLAIAALVAGIFGFSWASTPTELPEPAIAPTSVPSAPATEPARTTGPATPTATRGPETGRGPEISREPQPPATPSTRPQQPPTTTTPSTLKPDTKPPEVTSAKTEQKPDTKPPG